MPWPIYCKKQALKDDAALNAKDDLISCESAQNLAGLLETMAQKVEDMARLLKSERSLIAGSDYASLQSLVKELERGVADFLGLEAARDRLAEQLASKLGCDPKVYEIASRLKSEDCETLLDAAGKLQRSMKGLKSEFEITARLLEESKRLGDLMMSQLRGMAGGSSFSIKG